MPIVTLWSPFILTDAGLILRQRAIAGEGTLTFIYAKIGEGVPADPNNIPLMTNLVSPAQEVPVVKSEATGTTHILGVRIDNQSFTDPVLMTELGVFVCLDDEDPIMYGYSYATQGYDSIPAGSTSHYVWTINIDTVISRATSIELSYDGSGTFVTFEDLNVVNLTLQNLIATSMDELKARPGYFNGRGSIDTGIFYEDSAFSIEMEMVEGMLYIDLGSLRLYWCDHGKAKLISPTDTPDWNATSGPGYIAHKPDLPGRNVIRAKINNDFTLTLDDPYASILAMGMAYFTNGTDLGLTSVTISGVTGNQIKNKGSKKQVRIYAQVGIKAGKQGKKTISIYTYNGSSSILLATGQIYATAAGDYTLGTSSIDSLPANGYAYMTVSGAEGDVISNLYNLTFLTVDEI